jgi:hypothetical protein
MKEVKRRQTKNSDKCRNCTITYEVCERNEGKNSIKIFKEAFLSIFGLRKHRGRVENLQSTTPASDKMGKHSNKANKGDEESILFVKKHIESVLACELHYTRRQKDGRKYLGSEFPVQLLYDLYTEKCYEEN